MIHWLIDGLIHSCIHSFIGWLIDSILFDLITFHLKWLIDLIWFDFINWLIYLIWFDWITGLVDWFDLIWLIDWLIEWVSDWLDWIALEWIGLNWIGLDDINAYPYAWTVNFEICLDVQLRTYQPLIPKTSQASAWCHQYIGYWIGKKEGSPIRLGRNFGRLNSWKKNMAKVVDFEPLGALSGPGAPDPDLAHFQIRA